MTSTANGMNGSSYGWINYDLIQSGKTKEHMNAYGGEERFWLGPEGGQYSIYFNPGDEFVYKNWQVPKELDTEPFEVKYKTSRAVTFTREMELDNYQGTRFHLRVNRTVKLLDRKTVEGHLPVSLGDDVSFVAYGSSNSITNMNDFSWNKETGMLSIWMLSMLKSSPTTTIFIPYKTGSIDKFGPVLRNDFFGKIPQDRLKKKDGFIFFKADGKNRGKIGIPPERAKKYAGSFDEKNNLLTVLECELPEEARFYMNSLWKYQDNPFSGNVIYAYNDGPLEDGSQLGPYYELESSSPAANLNPGETLNHIERIYHFQGRFEELNRLTNKIFGIGLKTITNTF